jgi:mycothiol system anti-sigma-R factor
MTCQDFEIYISALVDGELESTKEELVESHLESCQSCQQEYSLLKTTKAVIKQNIPQEKAPVYLRTKIIQTIEKQKEKKARQWLWVRPWLFQRRALIPTLAVLTIVVSFVLYYIPSKSASARLVSELATTHGDYETAKRVAIRMTTSNRQQLSAWLRSRVDFYFEVPQLEQVNLNLIGGDIFGLEDLKGVHILYHNPSGHKTSLFIFQDHEKRLSLKKIREKGYEFYLGKNRDYSVLFWKKGRLIYSFVCSGADRLPSLVHCALWVRNTESSRGP